MRQRKDMVKVVKIQLHGQFETTNYGDLLLCILFYERLKRDGHTIIVKNACEALYEYLDESVKRKGKPDKIICCGGGYLCDGDFRFSLHMIKRIFATMAFARLKCIPYSIIGAGTKPFKNRITRPFIKWCINGADLICVRNEESKGDLRDIGIKKDIIVTADNVVMINESYIRKEASPEINKSLSELDCNKKNILLHVNYLPIDGDLKINNGGENLIVAITKFAESHPEFNYIITYDHEIAVFIEQCNSLYNAINLDNIVVCPGKTVYDVMNIINKSDIIITTKLHVGITGVALNKNVVSFPMHVKTRRFYKQLAALEHCRLLSECNDVNEIIEMIEECINNSFDIGKVISLKEKSSMNYNILRDFISDQE